MNFIWGLLTGILITIIACFIWRAMNKAEKPIQISGIESANPNPDVAIKKENMAKLENFVSQKQAGEKITNDDVQNLLKVSDATAERYLQELEQKGLLKQEGEIGKSVYYVKI